MQTEVHFPTAAASPQATAPTSGSPLFGVVISGIPVRTDFNQVDASKYTVCLNCPGDITIPLTTITELVIFLFQPLPPDQGILCYWQMAAAQEATGFELLGSLTPNQPSRIFHTGWGEHEQMVSVSSSQTPVTLTIGLSMEPLVNIENLNERPPTRLWVAQKIASDLFNYMQSFDKGSAGPGLMTVPQTIFDRWYQRFESRFRRNPNFFLKEGQD